MNETMTAAAGLRTYRGETIESLLPQIRQELGPDAVIVRQREGLIGGVGGFFQKRCVEIDARPGRSGIDVYDEEPGSFDEAPPMRDEAPPMRDEPLPAQDEQPLVRNDAATREGLATPAVQELVGQAQPFAEMLSRVDQGPAAPMQFEPEPEDELEPQEPIGPPRADVLRKGMAASGLGEDIAREVVDSVVASAMPFVKAGRLRTLVRNQLALRIPIAPAAEPGQRTIALVGPAGAGKTAAIAAIAGAHASRGTPVACLALDSSDNGAALEAMLAGSAARVVALPAAQLAPTPLRNRDGGLLLIDTPPLWNGAERLEEIAGTLLAAEADELHLVMRAGTAAAAGTELLDGLAALRPDRLLLTGAGETAHLGGVLDVAIRSRVPLGYVAERPRELALADPRDLASRVTP
jgi:flagellar biosynthesis protein FlhF